MKRILTLLVLMVLNFSLKAQIPISNLPTTTNTTGAYFPVARSGYNYKILTDSLTNKKVDSIKISNDSLYYYKYGGTRYFVGVITGASVDTTSLSNRINLKLNISDTTSKTWDWSDITGKPSFVLVSDTSGLWITSVYRKTGTDSVFYVKGGTHTFAFIDSSGFIMPTLQQVLAVQGNIAIIGNTDILPLTSGLDLVFGDAGSTLWNDIVLKGDGRVQMEAQTISNSKYSSFAATPDSIEIYAHLGQINIDSLRSWAATTVSDTTYKKVITWDTRNGRVEYSNWFGSGGGSGSGISQLGNTGNLWLTRVNDSTYALDTTNVSTYYLRRKDSLTASNLLGYVTRQVLADSTNAIRSNNSYISIDKTYDSLAWARNDSTLLVKSLRVQLNGSTVTPTTTDSTTDYNIIAVDSLKRDGLNVQALKNGNWITQFTDSIGSGSGGDTIVYSYNPADWLISQPHKSRPYFWTSGVAGDPTGSYYETSQYTPTPVKITNALSPNKGKMFTVTKGDFHRALFGWTSTDNGITWDTVGKVLQKSTTGWDKSGVSMAFCLYDSATNIIHMWYMGYSDSLYPSVFGVGYATASGNSPGTFTKQGEVLSGASFMTQIGMPHTPGYLKVSSVVKSREDGKYYFHGSYWIGNAATWPDSTIRLFQGKSATISGLIDSCVQILAPTGTNTLLENPTVYYGDDGNYWMIHTNGYTDLNGGIDSVQYLMTAKTASLKTPAWTVQPGIVFYPMKDSSWQGKRVYNAQLLKNTTDYYDRPISISYDSSGRDVDRQSESYWLLFYSASYPNSYHDQSSIARLLPQKKSENTYAIGFNGNYPNIIQKNGSAFVNIPFVDSVSRSGIITNVDYRYFHNKVKLGTAGRIAFYDSSLARVRDVPFMSVTTGLYPTMTLGASGYNSFTLNLRNTAGTTGSISEDGGMVYRGSSSYKKHIFYDQVSGAVSLFQIFSSTGAPFAQLYGTTLVGTGTPSATDSLLTVTLGVNFKRGVAMPNLPSGKKAKLVYWDNGTLYQADTTAVLYLTGSAALDFASTAAGAVSDLTITVTGAADGDVVSLGVPNASITATATFTAWVSAANTVTVRFSPKATEDPASGTFKVKIFK